MMDMTTEQRLAGMLKTATLLRTLSATDQTVAFGEYVRIVGIRGASEDWHVNHRRLGSEVLDATAAVARQSGETLDFHRIINARTDEAGSGAEGHESVVVRRGWS